MSLLGNQFGTLFSVLEVSNFWSINLIQVWVLLNAVNFLMIMGEFDFYRKFCCEIYFKKCITVFFLSSHIALFKFYRAV